MAQLLPRLRIDPSTDARLIKRLALAAETLPKVRLQKTPWPLRLPEQIVNAW